MNAPKQKMNTVKRGLMILALFIWISPAFSQEKPKTPNPQHEQRKERVQQLKIAYFTTELAMTSAEAEKFWPVYNELEAKLKANRKDRWKLAKELETAEKDSDLKQKTNAIFENEVAEVNIRKEYYEKIAAVISYKKATQVMKLEQQFKRELLHKMNNREPHTPHNKGPQQQSRSGYHKR